MKLRSMLPAIVVFNFLLAGGLLIASDRVGPGPEWVPPPDPQRLQLIALAEASANAVPPPHTTLDDIDASKLSAGCPPLTHEPWRGRIATFADHQASSSAFVLMADEPLSLTGEAFNTRGRGHVPQSRFSLSALPLNPDDPAQTRTILSRQFRWIAHEDQRAVYYYEQPAADGNDAIVSIDKETYVEKRWTLPLIPPPAGIDAAPSYAISVAGTTLDGKLIIQIYTGEWGAGDPAFPPRVHSGLCMIDPQAPSSTTPPPYVIVPDLLPIAMSWPSGPDEILALAKYPKQQKRLLINVATGEVREVAPDEVRFRGYGAMPPRIAKDRALEAFVQATNTADGPRDVYVDGLTVFGTAAVRLGMPSSELVPPGTPSVKEAGRDATSQWQFFAGAPRCITPTANGISRFSLSPATRDLALASSQHSLQTPFALEALDDSTVLLTQIVPPQPTAKDPALREGCLRLGLLTPATAAERWVGTVAFPDSLDRIPFNIGIKAARQGDSLILTLLASSEQKSWDLAHGTTYEQGEFWTRLPWPDALPTDVPDGWLGTITPRPGTPIP